MRRKRKVIRRKKPVSRVPKKKEVDGVVNIVKVPKVTAATQKGLAVFTYNTGPGAGDARVVNDLIQIADEGASVICLQEANDRQDAIATFFTKRKGWAKLIGPSAEDKAVTILYKSERLKVAKSYYVRTAIGYLGPVGAGQDRIDAKSNHVVVFTNNLMVVNSHLIVSAFSRPNMSKEERERRQTAWKKQWKDCADLIANHDGPGVWVGDMNCTKKEATFGDQADKRVNLRWVDTGGTFQDGRDLDHVVFNRKVTPSAFKVYPNSSDHHAVGFWFTLNSSSNTTPNVPATPAPAQTKGYREKLLAQRNGGTGVKEMAIATHNCGGGKGFERVVNDLIKIADTGATIICTQETLEHHDAIKAFMGKRPGWKVISRVNGTRDGAGAVLYQTAKHEFVKAQWSRVPIGYLGTSANSSKIIFFSCLS